MTEGTIVARLLEYARVRPEQTAIQILDDGETLTESLSYGQLHAAATHVAAWIASQSAAGERALLLYESISEYIVAFLGCLYAGVIAVPAYPPSSTHPHQIARLKGIASNAEPRLILTERSLLQSVRRFAPAVIATDAIGNSETSAYRPSAVSSDSIAFLQYTSGSTAAPRGVRVSHANIMANERSISQAFRIRPDDVIVSWLPLFHDMGLIGGLLQPLYSGVRVVLLSPAHFIERPVRWLQAISRFGGTVSGGPDFAYRLCAERVGRTALDGIDLSAWRLAFCGAEPIRESSLSAFADAFAAAGMHRRALYPCYGLAEATLLVTGGNPDGGVSTSRTGRSRDDDAAWVGCGYAQSPHAVTVTDSHTGTPLPDGAIGEICVRGPSVAHGYWANESATAETFSGAPNDTQLRTGDLGFIENGQLFVTGRIKDIIIVRGLNLYPQDIEIAIERDLEAVRKGRVAAFSVEADGREGVGIAAELSRGMRKLIDPESLFAAIDESVTQVCGERAQLILLLEPGTLPRTSSGKLQRSACHREWRAGALQAFAVREANRPTTANNADTPSIFWTATELQLAAVWKEVLNVSSVERQDHFLLLGGNSLTAAQVAARVEQAMRIRFPLRRALEFPVLSSAAAELDRIREQAGAHIVADIPRADRNCLIPMSAAQKRMWFLWKLDPASAAYHVTGALRFDGVLSVEAVQASLDALLFRHEILRSRFSDAGGLPRQIIDASQSIVLNRVNLSTLAPAPRSRELDELMRRHTRESFDLECGPPLRVTLCETGPNDYVMLMTLHHIVTDGATLNILVGEFLSGYEAFLRHQPLDVSPPPVQFADFAVWQAQEPTSNRQQLEYWVQRLGSEHPLLALPYDRPRPAAQSYQGASLVCELAPKELASLRDFAAQNNLTLYMLLLASFAILLQRYASQAGVRVGTPIAGRQRMDLEGLVGLLVNTQILCLDVRDGLSVRDWLQNVRSVVLDVHSHSDIAFEQIVEAVNPARSLAHHALFQVMYNHRREPLPRQTLLGPVRVETMDVPAVATQFDLSLDTVERETGLAAIWTYSTDLFDRETIQRMSRHWLNLLQSMLEPDQLVGRLAMLDTGEEQWLQLAACPHGARSVPEGCVHELIDAQGRRNPYAVAVIFGDEQLTYEELNARADVLAHRLQAFGVGPDMLVGICASRSIELVVGLLGVLKSGGAFLPLEPEQPVARLRYVLADARPALILVQDEASSRLPTIADCAVERISLSSRADTGTARASHVPPARVHPDNLAYCIYTSGSTGQPKGAGNTHAGLRNRLQWMQRAYVLTGSDRVLQKTPIGFDVSVWELFWPLMSGATLVMAAAGTHRDPQALREAITRHDVTTIHFVPSMLRAFVDAGELPACTSLRQVICSGEALSDDLRRAFQVHHRARLHNLYGPTEVSIDVTSWECERNFERTAVPIGRPIDNIEIRILSPSLSWVPIGVPGELYIGGVGLARGYLNRADLTADRFVPHPHGETGGQRLYRTGDLAKWRADGAIEYLGRIDQQVKIRGVRIELGEVQAKLSEHVSVSSAVVVAREDVYGDLALIAYIVPRPHADVALTAGGMLEEMRSFLSTQLPEQMLPTACVLLPELPVTENGKLDVKALPAPALTERHRAYVEPRNEHERRLAGIWSDVLQVQKIGIHDDFFELGGHSLLATQVVSRVREKLRIELPLRALFEERTVAGLSAKLQANNASAEQVRLSIGKRERPQRLPLSYAQQRLWFLWQLNHDSFSYHISGAVKLTGPLDRPALQRAFDILIERHEALRTTFQSVDGEAYQVIAEPRPLRITDILEAEPFDLRTGPLMRVGLVERKPDEHLLQLTLHHIIADGWSLNVLMRELMSLYADLSTGTAPSLPVLPIQYADYALWQREWTQGPEAAAQLQYWRGRLGSGLTALELPSDRRRPLVQDERGARLTFDVDPVIVRGLRAFARQRDVTLYTVLVSAFSILLHRYSAQEEFCIGATVANRNMIQTEGLIGFFVNMQVLRLSTPADITGEELLRQVHDTVLEAQGCQDLPFDQIVEAINPDRSLAQDPLFRVTVNHQWRDYEAIRQSGPLHIEEVDLNSQITQFDLSLNTDESNGRLAASFTYRTELFDHGTIERMSRHWTQLLRALLEQPRMPVARLPMLDSAGHQQVFRLTPAVVSGAACTQCLHELIEAQVERTPEATALIFGEYRLSYAQLNAQANRLAHYLQNRGVGPEVLVGICLERSPEMVVALLGVLKAGGVYLPLDPGYPTKRLSYMLSDARPVVVLTVHGLVERLPAETAGCICLDRDASTIDACAENNLPTCVYPLNLAYCIYTSGSTGRPKGSHITHGSLAHYVSWASRYYYRDADRGGNFGLYSSLMFDLTVTSLFVPLVRGRALRVFPASMTLDDVFAESFAERNGLDTIKLTPSHIALLKQLDVPETALRCAIVGGEALLPDHVRQLRALNPQMEIYNEYGPTEATVGCVVKRIDREDQVALIGRPIDAFALYVVEPSGGLAAIGVRGELYIGGIGLARGYLNRPGLTAERFIPDSFSGTPGARLYRTGDLARFRPDGQIEYCGRIDHQVKVRGMRIELGEIEARLHESPWVKDAVVLAREDAQGVKRLIGYVVPERRELRQEHEQNPQTIREEWVDQWRAVFAESYGESHAAPDFAGWTSSFTHAPISDEHMREWLDHTVARILALKPERVLEIGCGVGLLVQHVAPSCSEYVGTDFSAQALSALSRWLRTQPALRHVELAHREATQAVYTKRSSQRSGNGPETPFDTIVLNSVVQYFPDIEYLLKTLEAATHRLGSEGRLWIGDVRHLGLLESFHAAVVFEQASDSMTVSQLRARIQREVVQEKELVIDPAFFFSLPQVLPIQAVDVWLKPGKFDNELTRYRYDVVLHTKARASIQHEVNWDWGAREQLVALDELLVRGSRTSICIRNVPNRRLAADRALLNLLRTADERTTVRTLRDQLASQPVSGADPEEFWNLGRARGYDVVVRWSESSSEGDFDVELTNRRAADSSDWTVGAPRETARLGGSADIPRWATLATDPLLNKLAQQMPARLREQLAQTLPQYMVPAQWVLLGALPLTPNGKLDRKALPEPDGVDARVDYVPPQSSAERALAEVWKTLLNVSQVGVHDNFFELGGDSITAIQVVSRARGEGLKLAPRDLFQHQTIAELAIAVRSRIEPSAGTTVQPDDAMTGEIPLTPIQCAFFEQEIPQRQRWNQSVLLEWHEPGPIDIGLIERALQHLIEHHDSLRLRYSRQAGAWVQRYAPPDQASFVEHADLRDQPDVAAAVERVACEAHGRLDLNDGPLLRAIGLTLPQGRAQLLIVIHHLVVDGVSWRILLEDFQSAYRSLQAGQPPKLPMKTDSLGQWSRELHSYAASDGLLGEVDYWLGVLKGAECRVPARHPAGRNTEGSVRVAAGSLDPADTSHLLKDSGHAYGTKTVDILLAAFALAVCEWSGEDSVLIELEGHGREAFVEGIDVSRTVGWFTSAFPMRLRPAPTRMDTSIKAIKETLRSIPQKGFGYGVLKYLHPEARNRLPLSQPRITFNYLGQFVSTEAQSVQVRPVRYGVGAERCPEAMRTSLLDVSGIVHSGRLHLSISYSTQMHDSSEIENLLQRYLEHLRAMIAHCLDATVGGATPSDYPLARLTQGQLDELSLPYREIEDIYPLSPMQQGMLFHGLLEPLRDLYVSQHTCTVNAALDVGAFQKSWTQVFRAQGVLRTAFIWEGVASPLQIVHRHASLPFETYDWRAETVDEQARKLAEFRSADLRRGFDLSRPPLLRVTLIRLAEERYQLVWTDHHLLLDGWSSAQLMKDVLIAYDALVSGRIGHEVAAVPFSRFVAWQASRNTDDESRFWRDRLAGFETPTLLATRFERAHSGVRTGTGTIVRELSASLSAAIRTMGRRHRLTLSTIMQGAVAVLLNRHTREEDVMFGIAVSGRDAPLSSIEQMLGVLINTIPLRVRIAADQPTVRWLQALQEESLAARAHGFAPLVELQALTQVPRGTALFDTLLVVENFPVDHAIISGTKRLAMTGFDFVSRANYPLTLTVVGGDRCVLRLDHDEQTITGAVANALVQQLETVLSSMLASPHQPLRRIQMWPDMARREFVLRQQQECQAFMPNGCLHERFEAQVQRAPQAIAVVCGTERLTYQALNARANQVAHYLKSQGVGPDGLVGLCVERSVEMIVGLLGILKAGGAWLPLEPGLPPQRREYLLEDARPRLVLTPSLLSAYAPGLSSQPQTNPCRGARPDNLAYCIYTSGSTGRPKGALLTHRNVLRLFESTEAIFQFDARDVWTLFHSFAFDFSVWEIFGALLYGGRLIVVPFDTSRSPEALLQLVRGERVTVLNQTPSAFRQLMTLPEFQAPEQLQLMLRYIVFGGEAVDLASLERVLRHWGAGPPQLVNMYGITETTVHVTAQRLQAGAGRSPVGRPISDLTVWLLDEYLNLVPPGVCGEIYVAGDGLARGYLHRPDLTAERFIPNPWGKSPGERLYRSGDLAWARPDGRLEYLGRADQQVKIRGFRVELGEIESHLRACGGVRDATVLIRGDQPGDRELIAYVVPAAGTASTGRELVDEGLTARLRERLKAVLPDYMIPAHIVPLEQLPLTANGKLDRRALPSPSRHAASSPYLAPRTTLEQTLAQIWCEVLQVERVGVHDSFFELGGHSLRVTQLTARVQQVLHVTLPLRRVYEAAHIEGLAQLIQPLLEPAAATPSAVIDRLEALFADVQTS